MICPHCRAGAALNRAGDSKAAKAEYKKCRRGTWCDSQQNMNPGLVKLESRKAEGE